MPETPDKSASTDYSAQRLQVVFERLDDIVQSRLSGEMDVYSIKHFRTKLDKLMEAGVLHLLLDLSEVNYIDSSGLGLLVHTHQSIQKKGGKMVCLNPANRSSQTLLQRSRIISLLNFVDNRKQAMEKFQEKEPPKETEKESTEDTPSEAPEPAAGKAANPESTDRTEEPSEKSPSHSTS